MTKIGRFLRGFLLVDFFSSRFSRPFKDFQGFKDFQDAKKSCSCISLIFTGKAMHFYGLISKLAVLLIKEEIHRSNVQLLEDKSEKKNYHARFIY